MIMTINLRRFFLIGIFGFREISCFLPQHANHHGCPSSSLFVRAPERSSTQPPSPSTTGNSKNDISITLPRFYNGEVEKGSSYPSPLHTVHVRSILSDEETARCLQLSTDYAQRTGCWDQPDQERHATYSTCDFAVEDNQDLMDYLEEIDLDGRLWESLEELYGVEQEDMTYLDFFCSHYQANSDDDEDEEQPAKKTMDRLEAHRDGSLLSFTILLNSPDDFEGGGTLIEGLRDVALDDNPAAQAVVHSGGALRPLRAGDAGFHCGKLLHGADVVTSGCRTVLVGFVDVNPFIQRPGVLSNAARDWGRVDVALWRYKRQMEKTANGTKSGWFMNNARWIYSNEEEGDGRSCLKGFVPAFESVKRRADPEYQRLRD